MKKTIRKPEHWQDFESLCKKLWGEIWEIPNEIKKNGRLGQPQSGIDVYGIPKGKDNYFGIQAKGKDDYSQARLEESEIENEIKKAKTFKPSLEEFIIATTANKDAKIEEFVRIKDLENRKIGSFKILLFCWEDIADLIEENQDTFNWYINENNFREKFDVDVTFENGQKEIEISSIFQRDIKTFKLKTYSQSTVSSNSKFIINVPKFSLFESNEVNKSWNEINLVVENVGSTVIEDWKLNFYFSENISELDDDFDIPIFMSNEFKVSLRENRTTFAYNEDKMLVYKPNKNSPLIQKDSKIITCFLKTLPEDSSIIIEWELLARDFNKKGILKINSTPEYVDKYQITLVENKEDLKDDEIIEIKDYIEVKDK